jgi:hypothetical protein
MMYRTRFVLRLAFVALPLLLPAAARAGDDDAIDLAFWQSVQSSTNPAEYQAYLDAFPHGKFAKLALLRAHQPAPAALTIPLPVTGPTAKTAAVAPAAPPEDDDDTDTPAGKIVLEPAAPRVGQTIRVTCEGFPQPTNADTLVVVPAGTPVMDPNRGADQTKVVWYVYAANCFHVPVTAGPFAPGAYEIRFMTRLYSNVGASEMHAMTGFRVR